jgi:hypothetical protein
MTNFVDIIHYPSLIKKNRHFGEWSLSYPQVKPALLGPVDSRPATRHGGAPTHS